MSTSRLRILAIALFIFGACCDVLFAAQVSRPAGEDPGTRPAATATAPSVTGPGEALRIVVTAIRGSVQARRPGSASWEAASVGMVLEEGAELRTLPKSEVQFTIPPDQVVAVDRATVTKILRARVVDGKFITDFGMPAGRLRYDVESEGREHDTTIRSPNSILAVRGTKVALYDQPPFAAQAVSLTGTATFRDARKRIAFGGRGKTRVRADVATAAEVALSEAVVDPSISRARSPSEQQLVADLISRGAVTFFDPIRGIDVVQGGSVPTTAELAQTLPGINIVTSWTGNANVDMSVNVQNKGEFLYPISGLDAYPSGSRFLFDHRGGPLGGFEVASFPSLAPLEGQTYFVGARNLAGAPATVKFSAFDDGEVLLIEPPDLSGPPAPEQNVGTIQPGEARAILIGAGIDRTPQAQTRTAAARAKPQAEVKRPTPAAARPARRSGR